MANKQTRTLASGWERSRRASVRRALVAVIGIPVAFMEWGLIFAAAGGDPYATRNDDWRPGIIGILFGLAYLAVVGWWLDHRIAWRGGVVTVGVHVAAAGLLSTPWLFMAPDGGAQVAVNMLGIATATILAATVRGSFPARGAGNAMEAGGSDEVAATWRRPRLTTFKRWLAGLVGAGIGFGLTLVVWQSVNDRYSEAFLFDPVAIYAVGAGVYLLLASWWVDHLAARLGRWRAFLVHVIIAAVLAAPFAAQGRYGEGVILYVCVVATAVAAVLVAGRVPGSFASSEAQADGTAARAPDRPW